MFKGRGRGREREKKAVGWGEGVMVARLLGPRGDGAGEQRQE